jgi:hypothetical protein
MLKNTKNREVYIDEFRKKVGNEHFLYQNGEWVKVNLTVKPLKPTVHNEPK